MFLRAGETTENAIKEDAYETPDRKHYHPSKHIRPSSDKENVETNQLKKSSSNGDKDELDESAKTSQSEADVPDSQPDTGQPETDTSDDSEQETHAEATSSDDKSEKNEELKDGLEGLFQTLPSKDCAPKYASTFLTASLHTVTSSSDEENVMDV